MKITLQKADVINAITDQLTSKGLAMPISDIVFSKVTKTKPLTVDVFFGDPNCTPLSASSEATTSAPLSFEDSE